MFKKVLILVFTVLICTLKTNAQYSKDEIAKNPCFIGSTLFLLGNFAKVNKPDFVQLNLGYRLTEKDVISLELKTWKYDWPLGIPYGNAYQAPKEKFPGYIREKGFAVAYQRFLWKGLYTGVHVMNAWQNFINEDGQKIDNGFQIFNTYRIGYHIKLFKGNFFIEPSLAVTHRPYHSKMPQSFKEMDDKWSKFSWGEPGLHFGYNF
ncbi:hypothetical protein [Wenyingzhuangia sp. 2_MG-2023]|uniref:hypothetical protein n=1 Tax=Wenyingzhuangia sp. 2_MG-2023 TaxID=3062639 RepID=UPI0026E1B7D4|nr:hypothetical protein [Wenyingzhuangia sp. 2_MG-2023]MDO6739337.1 hypothetical protein [Wenyingzhuangia sp. 2_MG-2023]MDO6801950.1 hypothetical protein [Wenyingzhuangia sp. 1_MG-2023]